MNRLQRILPLRTLPILAAMLVFMLCLTVKAGAYNRTPWEEYGAAETGLTEYQTWSDPIPGIGDLSREPLYGLKDSAGNIVVPAKNFELEYAGKDRLIVRPMDDRLRYRVIDLKGNVLYQSSGSLYYFREADVFLTHKTVGGKNIEYLMDTHFSRITSADYLSLDYLGGIYFECSKGTGPYNGNDLYGVYKVGVGEIIPVKYSNYIHRLYGSNDLFVTKTQNYLEGLYDGNGKQILPEIYSVIDSANGDYIVAAKYKKEDYARSSNRYSFSRGQMLNFPIKNGELINAFGLFDIDGNEILPCVYDYVYFADNDKVIALRWNGTTSEQPSYFVGGSPDTVYHYDRTVYTLEELLKNQPTLADVPTNAWYSGAVHWAAEEGMIDKNARYLRPNENATRGEVVEYLWKAAGKPRASVENPFTDLTNSDSYYTAALWAYEKGITTGTGATTFSPKATCTRAQVVTFLFRAMNGHATEQQSKFTDVASTAYYADSVAWAVDRKITSGTTDTTFSPDATCTRAQILTFLYRAMA